ncbi:hypothetical protein GCM10023161_08260 [Mycobacterium paraffinicum]|uniref:Uncharacterized protein n=2 Tax=Mycobacterium paraffinicum TaxID=53378 RepID=A0ABP8RC97_9MYCO
MPAGSRRYCYDALSEISQKRDPMDVAGLSPERNARSGGARRSSPNDRRSRRPHASVVRTEPARRSQGSSPSAPAIERPAGDIDPPTPDAADHSQADYFVRLLSQNRRLIEHRLDDYQKAIVAAQANGDVDAVCNLRRMARIEEQDRDNLDGMLEKLRRRFARRTPGDPQALPARTRSAVR